MRTQNIDHQVSDCCLVKLHISLQFGSCILNVLDKHKLAKGLNKFEVIRFFYEESLPAMSQSPKSKWHDGQRQMNEAEKFIRAYTAF